MTAPRWIVEAIQVAMPDLLDARAARIAEALLERLPIEAMGAALALPIARLRDVVHRLRETSERAPDVRYVPMRLVHQTAFDELIAYVGSGDCGRLDEVVRALAADHDVVTIAELYQGAYRALDHAGVPYSLGDDQVRKQLDLAERITWLAQQRPTRLDLQRVEAERDAWHRRYDECIVTITANQQSIAALIGESETRRRERDQLAGEVRASTVALDAFEVPRSIEPLDVAERDSAPFVTLELDGRVRELGNTLARVQRELAGTTAERDYWKSLAEARAAAVMP